ncbi:hypothetical protein V6N12_069111 [Hibiscus sabdariffa]|uniref:Uncharacterized protein n=1 Tax=Hibiscus sabdariffa TaxID=183260 RepID=A0ABR2FD17_9ROSI
MYLCALVETQCHQGYWLGRRQSSARTDIYTFVEHMSSIDTNGVKMLGGVETLKSGAMNALDRICGCVLE